MTLISKEIGIREASGLNASDIIVIDDETDDKRRKNQSEDNVGTTEDRTVITVR